MATFYPLGFSGAMDAFRELRRLQEDMDRLVGGLSSGVAGLAAASAFPSVNIYSGQDGIAVLAELPGVNSEDIEVSAQGDTLTLQGKRTPVADDASAYHRNERRSGAFTRSVQLPYRIDPSRIEAHLENGVLRLSLPRPEEDKPRRITITS